ncbi:MAG: CRISPR-associated helicase Cas3' [Gemmatimonadaceae bacterium]|nr:CRISPR-associated helicase Cas3' [Gemmatimonadaceae bacterium]
MRSRIPTIEDLVALWGKAKPEMSADAEFHPLLCHLLDVAAVVEALLAARPIALERASRLLGLPRDRAQSLLVALAALHDLGKCTPTFQAKAPQHWPRALGEYDPSTVRGTHHTDDGYTLWCQELAPVMGPRLWPDGGDVLDLLAPAVFGHHGRPVNTAEARARPASSLFSTTGLGLARACADQLVTLLLPEPVIAPPLPSAAARAASWWVAGLITVADWIGSMQRWFPYTRPDPTSAGLREYWVRAREQAVRAIRDTGLVAPRPARLTPFEQLTGITTPSPMQRWAAEAELPPGPILVILEDTTGSGKTEAAQVMVHRLMTDGRAGGAYWAMPTQATANAMYARQREAIRGLFDGDSHTPSLVLAHGQAWLHEQFQAAVLRSAIEEAGAVPEHEDDELSGAATCAAFFADDRRAALAADVGAGTIDQVLLGVLPTRFNTVRLFGVSDKVLVLDEAHSYDAYMGIEAQELLRFHAALGGSAIVLTATLSRAQREAFVRAWQDGLERGRRRGVALFAPEPRPIVCRTEYPLATVVGRGSEEVQENPIPAAARSRRTVSVRLVHDTNAALAHVVAMAERGAAVAWVRNTVSDCLAAAAMLRARGITPIVFHGRFAQGDRQEREAEVIERFGRDATAGQRRGRIVIATQVIEQSLDLDFDALVSDLAPVDLLIQRAGRLWRHPARDPVRPPDLTAELVVLAPSVGGEPQSDWLTALLPGTAAVYEDVGVLWRTARSLSVTDATIVAPDGIRSVIEAVYGSDDVPEALRAAADRAEGKRHAEASMGVYHALKVSDGYDGRARGWVDDIRAPTRLGRAQTTVRLACVVSDGSLRPWAQIDGPPSKAWALSEVRASAKLIPQTAIAEPQYDAAVKAVRRDWGRFEREVVVLPLVQLTPDEWRGVLLDPESGRVISTRYTKAEGLAFADRIS